MSLEQFTVDPGSGVIQASGTPQDTAPEPEGSGQVRRKQRMDLRKSRDLLA